MQVLSSFSFTNLIVPNAWNEDGSSRVNCGWSDIPKGMTDYEIFESNFGGENEVKRQTFSIDSIRTLANMQEASDTEPLHTKGAVNIFYALTRSGSILVVCASMVHNYLTLTGSIPSNDLAHAAGSRVFHNIRILH